MSKTLARQFIKIAPLALIVVGLLAYNFMSAQWAGPTAAAPSANTSAPINISGVYQAKIGDLGAIRMRAGQYCNADGTVCTDAGAVGGTTLPTCSNGQTLVADASGAWVCGSGTTAPTTNWLVNNQHSESQCASLSGSVVTEGGVKFCRFNATSCPSGWAQYQLWSTRAAYTTGNVCPANTFGQSCSFSGIAWSNSNKIETRSLWCDGTSDNDNVQTGCTSRLSQIGCY
ncbi:MAG: hypothetical protein V4668_01545 [Patescibacteria group bacterium]